MPAVAVEIPKLFFPPSWSGTFVIFQMDPKSGIFRTPVFKGCAGKGLSSPVEVIDCARDGPGLCFRML